MNINGNINIHISIETDRIATVGCSGKCEISDEIYIEHVGWVYVGVQAGPSRCYSCVYSHSPDADDRCVTDVASLPSTNHLLCPPPKRCSTFRQWDTGDDVFVNNSTRILSADSRDKMHQTTFQSCEFQLILGIRDPVLDITRTQVQIPILESPERLVTDGSGDFSGIHNTTS